MLARRSTAIFALVLLAGLAIVSMALNRSVSNDPLAIISLQMSFTADRFAAVAEPWGVTVMAEVRRNLFLVDLAFPAAYALVLMTLFARFAPGAPSALRLAPVGAALADAAENTLHAFALTDLIDGGPASSAAVLGGSLFATTKWVLLLASLIALWRYTRTDHRRLGTAMGLVAAFVAAAVVVATWR